MHQANHPQVVSLFDVKQAEGKLVQAPKPQAGQAQFLSVARGACAWRTLDVCDSFFKCIHESIRHVRRFLFVVVKCSFNVCPRLRTAQNGFKRACFLLPSDAKC